jgi:O-antigen/teichoic acid export membrane protein
MKVREASSAYAAGAGVSDPAMPVTPVQSQAGTLASSQGNTGRHALLMSLSAIVVGILNYALNIVMSWNLSVEDYGRVGVSQTLIFVCVWFVSAGFPLIVTRVVAQAHEDRAGEPVQPEVRREAWSTFKSAWLADSVLTLAVVGLLTLAYFVGWLPLGSTYAVLIILIAITAGALGLGSVPSAALQGLFRFGAIAWLRIFEVGVNLVASLGLIALGFGAEGALAGFAIGAVLSTPVALWLMRDTQFWHVKGWGSLKSLWVVAPMTFAVFGGVLLTNVDLLSIKFLSSSADSDTLSGAYQVAAVLARAPLFISAALVSTFYPRIAQDSGNTGAARELIRMVIMWLLPVNLILVVSAPAVVLFFFPERYASSGPLLAVLSFGSACLVIATALAAVLQARHQVKVPALVMSGAVILQVVGLAFAVPAYGALAAALVSTGASVLALLCLVWKCRHLNLAPAALSRYGAALALLTAPALALTLFYGGQGRLFIALWVAGSLALYVMGLFALNLLDADRLSEASVLPRSGPAGVAIKHLLAFAALLNRAGWRKA